MTTYDPQNIDANKVIDYMQKEIADLQKQKAMLSASLDAAFEEINRLNSAITQESE